MANIFRVGYGVAVAKETVPVIGTDFTWTGGDGTYVVLDDGDGNWRIKFLSSGTFTPLRSMNVDAFLVGGGGGGAYRWDKNGKITTATGGAGYATTEEAVALTANTAYAVVIGAGGAGGYGRVTSSQIYGSAGGASSAFGLSANGGNPGCAPSGNGTGGSPTYEFGESAGTLYASIASENAEDNTGAGGGSGSYAGGSGIVIIRNARG